MNSHWTESARTFLPVFAPLVMCAILLLAVSAAAGAESERPAYEPRGQRRLIACYDGWGPYRPVNPTHNKLAEPLTHDIEAWTKAIQTMVHVHKLVGVDTIVDCVFERFSHNLPPGATTIGEHSYDAMAAQKPLKKLHDAGVDFFKVALEQAHRDGLTYLAGFRMNDRHGVAQQGKVYRENPQWHLEGFPGGFDFSKQPVRDAHLTFLKQLLDGYDVDGVEYDYMRWVYVFPRGTEKKNAPLLTDFMRSSRRLLDEAGRRRGRKLLLAARVPDRLQEAIDVGFDVPAWIEQGLIDYVVPSHFGCMDFDVKVEKYRELTEGTDCRVYPSTQGWLWSADWRMPMTGLGREHYYAAATNYYAFGADGISTYNYYYFSAFDAQMIKLQELTPMRDPQLLAEYDRHYLPWRRTGSPAMGTGGMHYDMISLDRSAPDASGSFTFRMSEDLADPAVTAVMQFKAIGLAPGEQIAIELNGRAVDPGKVDRFLVWDGREPMTVKMLSTPDGRTMTRLPEPPAHEPYDMFWLELGAPPMRFGDNELAVRLTRAEGDEGTIKIEEVEIKVHGKPGTR